MLTRILDTPASAASARERPIVAQSDTHMLPVVVNDDDNDLNVDAVDVVVDAADAPREIEACPFFYLFGPLFPTK